MAFAERLQIIRQIQEQRGSKLITYFTGDRRASSPAFQLPGLTTQLATESQLFLYDQLRSLEKTDNLDLFLYTRGGDTDSVWPLVSIFREYAHEQFTVLVPFRAHSAGTMICLGADRVVMGEAGELSPIDPTTGNQFNPLDEGGQGRKGISVEDVTSYMRLATDKVQLQEPGHILEVFKALSQQVHPLALGNVNRVHTQIRILAKKLLKLHMDEQEEAKIDSIVDMLTEKLYSHTHALNRREAREIFGDEFVVDADEDEQRLMWDLFEEYAVALRLREAFCLDPLVLSGQLEHDITVDGGFIETENYSLVFRAQCHLILSSKIPQGVQVQIPSGQPMPLIRGLPVNVDVRIVSIGWQINQGEV